MTRDEYLAGEERGTVQTWLPARAFGFIRPDRGGPDLFFHTRGIDSDCKDLWEPAPGDRVVFQTQRAPDGRARGDRVRPA